MQQGAVEKGITEKLQQHFQPVALEVINESTMHSVPPNSETHFKVVVVSEHFAGCRPVQRHQQVYALLADEMAAGVHALALHTHTPEEWAKNQSAPASPDCLGGSKADQ